MEDVRKRPNHLSITVSDQVLSEPGVHVKPMTHTENHSDQQLWLLLISQRVCTDADSPVSPTDDRAGQERGGGGEVIGDRH